MRDIYTIIRRVEADLDIEDDEMIELRAHLDKCMKETQVSLWWVLLAFIAATYFVFESV